jgi:hypothetical protein
VETQLLLLKINIFLFLVICFQQIRAFLPILDEQLALQSATNDNTRFIAMALKELSDGDGDEDKIQGILDMKNFKLLISLATRSANSVPLLIY